MFTKKRKLLLLILFVFALSLGLTLAFFSKYQLDHIQQESISKVSNDQIIGANTYEKKAEIEDDQPENQEQQPADNQQTETFKVTRVIDGDTIEIESGQKVRYIGIDTPETVDPRTLPQCFGSQAAAKNRELVEGKNVSLEKDVSETDKYGRLLRYVFIDGLFVNEYLVKEGFAYASSYPPDVKYQDLLASAQNQARSINKGLWSLCQNQNSSATIYNNEGCQIKGNISQDGEKIYHLPDQNYYDKTVINEGKGERWFCSEDDAISAGWRKSKT